MRYYIGSMNDEIPYRYTKMFQVSDGYKVTLNLPVDLIRDFWKLKPGDKVLVRVDKNYVYRVRPMK